MFHSRSFLLAAVLAAFVCAPVSAGAVSITQAEEALSMAKGTHPPLRLTPDKSELVRLPRGAVSVIVGNPAHMNVLAESSTTLVIVPKASGASHFTALDAEGQIIIQRHVIVGSPQENYIRVRRTCSKGDENCQGTSVYYCPDMCHEIAMNQPDAASAGSDVATGSEGAASVGAAPEADTPEGGQ